MVLTATRGLAWAGARILGASLVAGLVASLAGCVAPDEPGKTAEQAGVACGDGPTVDGMDASYYETSIDWTAAHAAGIDFAFIRVSDGLQFPDPKFASYWDGAKAAGVMRGAYQFFRPAQDPIAQADLLLDRMGPVQPGDLPPVIDVEVSGGLTTAEVAASVRAWVDHVTAAIGRPPIIYAGLYSWKDLTGSADITTSPLWVAQYTSAPCPNIPTPWTRWMFWQHTATGTAPGVPGDALDLDWFNGTLDELRAITAGTCGDGRCNYGETVDSCPADCPPCSAIGRDGGVIDDGDACFAAGGPAQYLRHVTTGEQGDLIWTHATASAKEANFAQWNLRFDEPGRYLVEAYTSAAWATSRRAAYAIEAGGTRTTVMIDQTAVDGWQSLGEIDFAASGAQSIHLADNTGEPSSTNMQLVFDAIRLTRIAGEPSPPPPPGGDNGNGNGGDDPGTPPSTAHSGGCSATGDAARGSAIALWLVSAWYAARRRRRTSRDPR